MTAQSLHPSHQTWRFGLQVESVGYSLMPRVCASDYIKHMSPGLSAFSPLLLCKKKPFSTGKTVVAASAILFLFYLYSFVGFTGAVTSSLLRSSKRFQTYRRQIWLWYHKLMPKLTSIALNFVFAAQTDTSATRVWISTTRQWSAPCSSPKKRTFPPCRHLHQTLHSC